MIVWFRRVLWTILAISGIAVATRAIFGPFHFILPVVSPMNAEGIFAVSGAALIASHAREAFAAKSGASVEPPLLLPAVLTTVAVFAFWRMIPAPLLADDYDHIPHALDATVSSLAANFVEPAHDRFFRPAVFAFYAAEARVAGYNREIWHAFSLTLHVAVSLLVFCFLRRRNFAAPAALAGSLLFLLHASHPEAVAWVSAQFDLWAALFFLLALLAFERGHRILSLAPLAVALLSKESAYVYPFLLAWMLYIDRAPYKLWPRLVGPSAALTLAAFAYRWSVVGGIGGYQDEGSGRAYIFTFDFGRTAKALFLRYSAALDFPINWSRPLEWWLIAAFAAALALGTLLFTARADLRRLAFGAGFLILAALPVHEFLLFDSDLEKSRVLYLPSVGLAFLFAALFDALRPRLGAAAAASVLIFQTAALEHNLAVWTRVGQIAERACAQAAAVKGPAVLSDISNVVDGVYFLHTGLRGCVKLAGKSDIYLESEGEAAPPGVTRLEWDEKSREWAAK